MASSNALSYMRRKTARYVRNVGRSVGYVAIEELKPHSSTITQLYKDSKELSNNLKASANARRAEKLRNRTKTTTLSASANRQKRSGSTFSKNLLSDLKSGKWYNQERMDKASTEMFDMGADADNYTGVSFDFGDDDFGDALFNDGQGEPGGSTPRRRGSTVSKAFNQVGMAASAVTAEASIRSAEFIANSNNMAAQAIYDSMNYNFGQVMLGLSSIDTNIQVVQATVGDTLNTHALNSAKFYIDSAKYQQESLELLKKISTAVESINTNTSPAPSGGARRGAKGYTMSGLLGGGRGGLIDFKALAANAKTGFREEFIPNLLLMLGLGGDMGGSGGLVSNPIGIITTEILKRMGVDLIPRRLKGGVGNVNNVIRNFFGQGIARARGADFRKIFNQNNPLLAFLSPFFNELKTAVLPKSNYTKINTGNYNKRRVDWDGIARKSLVEVIPTQLGKILSALTGENEMRYDYEHGKWVDTHQHLKEFNENRRKEKMLMGGDFVSYGQSLINNKNNGMTAKERARMNNMLEDFNQGVYKSAGTSSEMEYLILIDPKRRIDSSVMAIARKYGIRNQTELLNMRKLAAAMRTTPTGRNALGSYGTNMAIGKDIAGQNNRYKESLNDAMINMMVDGSYNFGNAAVAKTKASGIGSRANWEKNKQSGIQSIMYATDKYNHDIFFYLQGIFQYTKHVSDNLPLLVSGTVKGGKRGKITGVRLTQVKDVEPIKEETIEFESEEIDSMGYQGGNNYFKTNRDVMNAASTEFDGTMSDTLKEHARARQWAMQNGMLDYMIANNEEFAKNEKDYQAYVSKFGGGSGKIRNAMNRFRPTRSIVKGYDKFVNILEAVGGSRKDLEDALGFMLPFKGKVDKFRRDLAQKQAMQGIFDPRALESIAGGYNGQAAKGRKVTKTGIVAVSEGELIIPSEMNPFYHGVTNKAKQIRDEQRAVQQYFGSYAKGGKVVVRPDMLQLPQLRNYFLNQNLAKGMKYDEANKAAFKEAKKVISSWENENNSGKRGAQIEGRGAVTPFDLATNIDGMKHKVQGGLNTIGEGMVNMFGPRDKKESDAEKKQVGKLIDGIMQDAGMAKSSIITGSVLGGGISLLAGAVVGPLAGAAIGAATGLITKSQKVQEALFGKDVEEDVLDENGKKTGTKTVHKKGLLSEKLSQFMTKNLPSMAKGTASGVLAGTAFFGSPIIGGIVGSSIGFISSSDKAKNFLFGDIDKQTGDRKGGVIPKKVQDAIKKAVPNMAAGGALGLLIGPLSASAGGLAGNIILGSALGFMTSTNKFQKWLYGEEDPVTHERKGGFADKVKSELFDPISRAFGNLTSIASQQFVNLSKSLARSAKDFLFKHVGKALMKTTIGRKLMGAGKKLAGGAWKLLTAPGKALDTHFRKKALNKGYTIEGLTSEERMNLRYSGELGQTSWDPNGEGFTMDQFLVGLKDNESRKELLKATKDLEFAGRNSENAIIAERKRVIGNLRKIFSEAGFDNKRSRAIMNEIYTQIASGDIDINDPQEMLKIREAIRQATGNKLDDLDHNETYQNIIDSLKSISTDSDIRASNINDAKSKIADLIEKSDALGREQKDVLRKQLLEGKFSMKDIDYIQNQLGIDIKNGKDRNPIENAVTSKIPDKIDEVKKSVDKLGERFKDVADTLTGKKKRRRKKAKAAIDAAHAGNKEIKDPTKYGEDVEKEDPYEGMMDDQYIDDDEFQTMARGGFARRGLAAVSKGELILPRSFWGSFAGGDPNVNNPDIDTTGEDNVVRGQHGNVEENLGSKKVQDAKKNKGSFFSAMKAIPAGFASMNATLTDIKDALVSGYREGNGEKKKGLLDMLKDSFLGGASDAVNKVKSLIASAIGLAAPAVAALIGAKIALEIHKGTFDKAGEKLGWGQASHKGDTYIDSDGDYVSQDPETGVYVKDDGTPANGDIKAVNSSTNDPMSERFDKSTIRGLVTGKGTPVGALIKGGTLLTKHGKGFLGAVGKGAKAVANAVKSSKAITKLASVRIGKEGINVAKEFAKNRAAGKTATEAMKEVSKSSNLLGLRSALLKFASLMKKVPILKNSKFVSSIDDLCEAIFDFAQKKTLGSGAKMLGSTLKSALFVVNAVFIVTDVISGWQDAEKILGIKNATNGQRFLCAFCKAALKQIPYIGAFLPEKPLIQFVAKLLEKAFPGEKSLTQQQDEMQEEVDNYNAINGTNLSVDEYLTQHDDKQNIFDRAGNSIKTGIANIKQSIAKSKQSSASTEEVSAGESYLGSYANGGVVGGVSSLISGAVNTYNAATDMSRLPALADKIKEDVDKGDVKGIIQDVGKVGLGVAAGTMFPALIGPALVNAMINKITGTTDVNKSGSSGKFTTLFNNIEKIFSLAKDGDTKAIDAIQPSTDNGMFKGIFNVIKGIGKIASVVTDPIQWLGNKISNALGLGGSTTASEETSASGSGFISQFDPQYRGRTLGGRSIADNGCGPAAAVMAINQMNGRGTSMNSAINHASRYQTAGGTDAGYFADEFARNGYRAQYSTNRGSMLQNIAAGRPTILMGRAGSGSKDYTPFGPNNHYVVANGMDRRGNIIVSDPEQGRARAYHPSIMRQVRLGISGGASVNTGGFNVSYSSRGNIGALGSTVQTTPVNGSPHVEYPNAGTPTDNITKIWGYLKSKGLSDYAAAGLMGCWQIESHNSPDTLEGNHKIRANSDHVMHDNTKLNAYVQKLFKLYKDQGKSISEDSYLMEDGNYYPGYGLAQWTGSRTKALMDFAKSNNRDHRDLVTQLDYFWSEYLGRPKLQKAFDEASSVKDGTIAALDYFEMSPGWHNTATGQGQLEDRYKEATKIYQQMNGLSGIIPEGGMTNIDATDVSGTAGSTSSSTKSSGGILSQITSAFSSAFDSIFGANVESNYSEETGQTSKVKNSSSSGILGTTGSPGGDRVNGFPYYNQGESPWATMDYGYGTTIKSAGCGPTSAAMILKSYGVNTTPEDAANYSLSNGFRVQHQGTGWGFFDSIGKQAGLTTEQFASKDTAKKNLNNNIPVIASMTPGDFTDNGHFLVLSKLKGNELYVNDPGSRDRSGKIWDADYALNQAQQFWAMSKNGVGSIGRDYDNYIDAPNSQYVNPNTGEVVTKPRQLQANIIGESASGSRSIYNTMGRYIANRGIKPQAGPPEVHYVGSGTAPIIHKSPTYNYMSSGRPVASGFTGGSPISTTNTGNNTMVKIVDTLCDIVQELTDNVSPSVTGIYDIMKEERDSLAAKGTSTSTKPLKNSSMPLRTKTNEQIAASLSELKAQVRQIVI